MPALRIGRRALPLLAIAAAAAPARADTVDLALNCDPTLAPALRKASAAYRARTGVHVFVFPTGPALILPQLTRDIQNDILVTQVPVFEQAERLGIIASDTGGRRWRNPVVVAGLRGAADANVESFAVTDPIPGADIDGPAVLARLGLRPARVLGALDTDEVAFLLTSGAAQVGLLHLTDVRADDRLAVLRSVPPEIQPPLQYTAGVTRLSQRPNPQGFISFLGTAEGGAILASAGLEAFT